MSKSIGEINKKFEHGKAKTATAASMYPGAETRRKRGEESGTECVMKRIFRQKNLDIWK